MSTRKKANVDDSPPCYILDSYALLAYLEGEQGPNKIKALLVEASREACHLYMSWINLGEVLYITERERGLPQAHAVLAIVEQLPIHLIEASSRVVLDAAHIKAHYPVSFADAFAIAVAQKQNGVIVTGDPEFETVEEIITIQWLKKY